jgi:hypothetical protein
MGSHTVRPQDRETCTFIQRIGDTLAKFWMLFVCATTFISLTSYNTVKGFKENFAGSQTVRRLRAELAAQ